MIIAIFLPVRNLFRLYMRKATGYIAVLSFKIKYFMGDTKKEVDPVPSEAELLGVVRGLTAELEAMSAKGERFPEGLRPMTEQVSSLVTLHRFETPRVESFMLSLGKDPEFMKLSQSGAFKSLDKALGAYFLDCVQHMLPETSMYRKGAEGVFSMEDWNLVPDNSAFRAVMIGLYAKLIELRGKLVKKYLEESSEGKKMNFVERYEYQYFGDIADATNQLFLRVSQDPDCAMDSEGRLQKGFTDEFAVVHKDAEGEPREVKWNVAFAEETSKLSKLYEALADELELTYLTGYVAEDDYDGEDEFICRDKIQYYRALQEAYRTCKIEDWGKADALFVGQGNGKNVPMHVHTFETGYAKDTIQRTPESSMRCPDADFAHVNEMAFGTREMMFERFGRFVESEGGFSPEFLATRDLVKKCGFGARHFMGSGMEIFFKPAAQVLPNDELARRNGVDVSADCVTYWKRISLAKAAYAAIFGTESPVTESDVPSIMGKRIASHEFGHALGITPTLDGRMAKSIRHPFSEEWKATVGGMVLNEFGLNESERDMEDLRSSITYHVVGVSRYLALRGDAALQPYVRESLMITKVMQECGLLVNEGDNWKLDLSDDAKVIAFYETIKSQWVSYMKMNDRGNTDDLRKWLAENLKTCEFAEFAAQKVDAHFGKKNLPTPEDLCRVPQQEVA